MNFKKVLRVFLVVGVLCLLAVTFLTSSPFVVGAGPQPISADQAESRLADGYQLRVIIIRKAGDGPGSVVPSDSVQARFVNIVNSGRYDIVWTKTVYREGRMVVAEIYYRDGPSIEPLPLNPELTWEETKELNCLRVKIITAVDGGPGSVVPSRSVQARFMEIVNGGRYDIVTTKTVYQGGRMVVAEIYYQAPNCSPRVEPLGQ